MTTENNNSGDKTSVLSGLERIVTESKRRKEEGAERYAKMDRDLCQICWAYGADKRSLYVDCWYDLSEAVEEIIAIDNCGIASHPSGYYLLICKTCRAEFIGMMREWAARGRERRALHKDHDGCVYEDSTDEMIPVRIDGATVMMDADEYQKYCANRSASK